MPAPVVKRPALIWFTQAILVPLFLAAALGLIASLTALTASNVTLARAALGIVVQAVLAGLLAYLFYGLVRRRRWAWAGSIAFAIVFLIFVVIDLFVLDAVLPQIAPAQRRAVLTGRVLATILAVIYPTRFVLQSQRARLFRRREVKGLTHGVRRTAEAWHVRREVRACLR